MPQVGDRSCTFAGRTPFSADRESIPGEGNAEILVSNSREVHPKHNPFLGLLHVVARHEGDGLPRSGGSEAAERIPTQHFLCAAERISGPKRNRQTS